MNGSFLTSESTGVTDNFNNGRDEKKTPHYSDFPQITHSLELNDLYCVWGLLTIKNKRFKMFLFFISQLNVLVVMLVFI